MIDVYSWPTANNHKVHVMLEEAGLEYSLHPVDITAGDQFTTEFQELNLNSKVPVIVDHDGPEGTAITLFESGAILLYLAEKTGKFLPTDPIGRYSTIQWLMFQVGGIGPMFGQAHHFRQYAKERIEYAVLRYTNEARRLYGVMEKRLHHTAYLASEEYTIADIATFPWTRLWEGQGVVLDDYPKVKEWHTRIASRPAVQRGVSVLSHRHTSLTNEKARRVLFGLTQ